jgi:hypothetical protein
LRSSRHVYVLLDARPQSYHWFHDPALPDALPADVKRFAYDLYDDPLQLRPILPATGRDDLLDRLHAELESRLAAIDDDFCERYAGLKGLSAASRR